MPAPDGQFRSTPLVPLTAAAGGRLTPSEIAALRAHKKATGEAVRRLIAAQRVKK